MLMKSIRLLLLSSLLALLPSLANAAEKAAFLNLTDGTTVGFFLSEDPVVYNTGDTIIVRSTKYAVKYALKDVRSITFGTMEATGIQDVTTSPEADVNFRLSDAGLNVTGLPDGTRVALYNLSGAKVAESKVAGNGASLTLPSQGRPSVYIVRTSTGISYKLITK